MSEESETNKFVLIEGGLSLFALVVLLVACMHYGCSCTACGCTLVDSEIEETR